MNKHSPQSVAIALAMAVALGGAATGCGSDSETKDASATTSQTAETTTTTGASSNKPGEVTVVASDYMFEGLPKSVPAGTKLVMENQSKKELHEMVVVRFPDDEKRSIDEIAKLPEAEVDAIFGGCLLYTSDAADERSSVDLGGRRIIKKKTVADKRGSGNTTKHTNYTKTGKRE